MSQQQGLQQKVASTIVDATAKQLAFGLPFFQDGGGKVTFCTSVAMVGVAATATHLTEVEGKEPGKIVPDADMVQFACLYLANASSFSPNGELLIEFCLDGVIKTLDQFQQMTGRSYEGRLDKSLMEKVRQGRKNASEAFTGDFSKFRPQ